mmetsp:Transcript_120667/g.385247  ORF Transcript_120667/g.385247 Transcript_120667/m.385247 type:complete len:207 (+) Transcript_120667:3620-4240(+)
MFDIVLHQLCAPKLCALHAHACCKGADVRDHACCDDAIARQKIRHLPQILHVLPPACLLAAQPTDELVSTHKLDLAEVHVVLQFGLLSHSGVEVGFELRDLRVDRPELLLCRIQLLLALVQLQLSLPQHDPLRLDPLGDEVVFVHRTGPHANGFASKGGLLDRSRVEVFAIHVGCNKADAALGDVVLVEFEKVIQKLLRIRKEHLL